MSRRAIVVRAEGGSPTPSEPAPEAAQSAPEPAPAPKAPATPGLTGEVHTYKLHIHKFLNVAGIMQFVFALMFLPGNLLRWGQQILMRKFVLFVEVMAFSGAAPETINGR